MCPRQGKAGGVTGEVFCDREVCVVDSMGQLGVENRLRVSGENLAGRE